jgi:UDP-N-acetylglucosamine:LPS N-acetylglucosamine transferase
LHNLHILLYIAGQLRRLNDFPSFLNQNFKIIITSDFFKSKTYFLKNIDFYVKLRYNMAMDDIEQKEPVKKPKILFPFVEAGLGHIMPMTAVADAFSEKYGDRCEIIRTKFFKDKGDPDMAWVEEELIREVKKHNRNRLNGFIQFAAMRLFGQKTSLKFVYKSHYKRGFKPSVGYLKEMNADLIFNTHFATLYYACEARAGGVLRPDTVIAAYCPDPVIGLQWDKRADLISLSSSTGAESANKSRTFKKTKTAVVPFLIRKAVEDFTGSKEYYKDQIGVPKDRFTILLADGAYGAGRLKKTVYELLKSRLPLNVIAVCGRNEALYREFLTVKPPENIIFKPYGFTDKMLLLSAACDLFIGKAGASNLAEPAYFGAPAIITFTATPIEKWICRHYTHYVKSAVKITNVRKAVKIAEQFAVDPAIMEPYKKACESEHRTDGPDKLADILWEMLPKNNV